MPKKTTVTRTKATLRRKSAGMTAVKTAAKVKSPVAVTGAARTQVSVLDADGKAKGKITLPPELFGAKINKQLVAQAVRVYLANQREGSAATKTRGEVEGSTRKIYRQKGTGRARHGAIRAPIFVGGGITFGPQPRHIRLTLPKKMRQVALASALTMQYHQGNVLVATGLEDLEPKTKIMAAALKALGASGRTLLVLPQPSSNIVRGCRNIPDVEIMPVGSLNTYTVLANSKIIFSKDALSLLKQKIGSE